MDECKSKMEEAFQNAEECKMVFAPMKDLALENADLDIDAVAQLARNGEKVRFNSILIQF